MERPQWDGGILFLEDAENSPIEAGFESDLYLYCKLSKLNLMEFFEARKLLPGGGAVLLLSTDESAICRYTLAGFAIDNNLLLAKHECIVHMLDVDKLM